MSGASKPRKIAAAGSIMPPGKEPRWLIASLLYPVVATEPSEQPYRHIYRPYLLGAPNLFALTDLADADLALIPTD
jgi:hypothetical protein